jgi:uncharacterized protein involved in exopolysaccharide biosynthesis
LNRADRTNSGRRRPQRTTATAEPKTNPELEKLHGQLSALRIRYSEDHPDVKRLRLTIDKLEQMETERERREEAALAAQPREAPKPQSRPAGEVVAASTRAPRAAQRPSVELLQARERVETLKSQVAMADKDVTARLEDEGTIRREMARTQARIERLPIREQEMAQVMRDYEISRANYQSLMAKKLAAGMATDMERRQKSERFTIVDPARIPMRPIRPNRQAMFGMGSMLGLALGLAVAIGNELRRNVLLGEWELPPGTVVMGVLPKIQVGANAGAPRWRGGVWAAVLCSAVAAAGYYVWLQRF